MVASAIISMVAVYSVEYYNITYIELYAIKILLSSFHHVHIHKYVHTRAWSTVLTKPNLILSYMISFNNI